MDIEGFKDNIRTAAEAFRHIDRSKTVRIVSHLDADGICACSILIHALNVEKRKYSISIVNQLTEKEIKSLSLEEYTVYVFSDLGSGQLELIDKLLPGKTIFILDHHMYNADAIVPENITVINPHKFGIDGTTEISGSGVVFMFAKELSRENERMAHIALIGAIGDLQEKNGFSGLNSEILDVAVKARKIEVKNGLRWFGADSRPLYKLLAYSTDPYIPQISGSTSKAIQFLNELEIEPKANDDWRKFSDLTEEEKKKLVSAIIMKRVNEEQPEDILGNTYIISEEKETSPIRDAREFSTLLNACGRLNRASLGIGACLNDPNTKEKAVTCLADYKKEIMNALSWFERSKNTKDIISARTYMIINAKDNIMPTIAGTLASIISKSNDIKGNMYIMTLARHSDDTTKISLRMTGVMNTDLRDIIREITLAVGGEAGGHRNAAGAIIPTAKENEFIEAATRVLANRSIEERINP